MSQIAQTPVRGLHSVGVADGYVVLVVWCGYVNAVSRGRLMEGCEQVAVMCNVKYSFSLVFYFPCSVVLIISNSGVIFFGSIPSLGFLGFLECRL